MNKPFDPTKPVQTRDGRPARILTTESKNPRYPIVALAVDSAGKELGRNYTAEGYWSEGEENDLDLVNVLTKIRIEGWLNVYPSSRYFWDTQEDADAVAGPDRLACVKISCEVTEGEGL